MRQEDSITVIKGIGEKTAESFQKLGIFNVRDLLYTFPRTYLVYGRPVRISDAPEGERCAIFATVSSFVDVKKGGKYTLTSLSVNDGSGSVRMIWFNSPYLRGVFHKGESYVFVGRIETRGGMHIMRMPEYYTQFKYQGMLKVMQPVYSLTAGLTNNTFKKAIEGAAEVLSKLEDPLETVRAEYGLMSEKDAILNVHFPKDEATLKDAIRRMALNEFVAFLLDVRRMQQEGRKTACLHIVTEEAKTKLHGFVSGLPYRLTNGQRSAVEDITKDMESGFVMNRLVQGDVGSGKTIVAASAVFMAAFSGFQSALMVPTEVLAMQHFKDLTALFKPYKLRVALLTGSMKVKEKREVYEALKEGEIDVVVGTHAIIQDKTEFHNLGLVITDEQHRFGVGQRQRISEKGNNPHVLIMSATPIPRTLAIIMYADMDISVISELPGGRKRIKNCVVGTGYRPTAYRFIEKEVSLGHQAYVICPMVEETETMDAENVTDYADELKSVFQNRVSVEYLHGKMKEEEKNRILQAFIDKKIDVLVSTTVIEVGINNPNATVMMIENAERFGLAQLHQLRGRVGRGDAQSYCIFINAKKSKESEERLKVLEETNDGFKIASEDLKLRGPGDFFGIRQSGDICFQLADIYNHADMLRLAQEIVIKYGDTLGSFGMANTESGAVL